MPWRRDEHGTTVVIVHSRIPGMPPSVHGLRLRPCGPDRLRDPQAFSRSLRKFTFGVGHVAQRDTISGWGRAALGRHLLRGRLIDASTSLRKNVDPRCRSALSYSLETRYVMLQRLQP